jgi:CRP-like cAMP-binding protein
MQGEEGVVAFLREGDFIGESCVAHDLPVRTTSAVTVSDCRLIRIDRRSLLERLHQEKDFSDLFLSYVIRRSNEVQEHLIDHLFNPAEKRLARILLSLARLGTQAYSESTIPALSQQTLAEMVGTSRPRISIFMNRFKKLGFVDYGPMIKVKSSLFTVLASNKSSVITRDSGCYSVHPTPPDLRQKRSRRASRSWETATSD